MKQFRKYRVPFHHPNDPTHRSRAKRSKHINLFYAVRQLNTDIVHPSLMVAWRYALRKQDIEFGIQEFVASRPWRHFLWR